MLTADQSSDLAGTGVVRIAGVLERGITDRMADAIWESLAPRGIDRDDRQTWLAGFVGKHQRLRKRRVFDDFDTERTAAVANDLLGVGSWRAGVSWGPALVTFPQPGPWTVPHGSWHFDRPGHGGGGQP